MKLPNPVRGVLGRIELRFLRQRARLAQARKDWAEAVRLWRKCEEKAPGRFHNAGYLSALIYAGRIEEAEKEAHAHRERFPADENGRIALARVAEARGDLIKAAEQWRAALELRLGNRQALIRLGTVLLTLKLPDEAEACAGELLSRYPSEPHGEILRAEIAQQRKGFESAAPLWRTTVERFPRDRHLLRVYGRALISAGAYEEALGIANRLAKFDLADGLRLRGGLLARQKPYADHTAFWRSASQQLPDNTDVARKWIHAALWARHAGEAEEGLQRLLRTRRTVAGDADFVIGLGNLYLDRQNFAGARGVIRTFIKAMRSKPDYYAAALRLNRLILACFPASPAAAIAISHEEERFRRMVMNVHLPLAAAGPLLDIAHLETGLRRSKARCLLDTDIDVECGRAFVRLVRERLANRQPFSLIRLGDGEANAFQDTSFFAAHLEADAAEREIVWWGRALAPAVRTSLADQVQQAAMSADAIGFPTREWFLRDVRMDTGRALASTKSGRGLLVIAGKLHHEDKAGRLSGKVLVSAHLPQDLHRWNLYGELLNGSGEIVLVSCHTDLPSRMESMFNVHVVHHTVLPPGDSMREMQHRLLEDDELPPLSIEQALAGLGSWPEGRLVLVGAGYAGKLIIHEARRRGGIALDLGSIFDHWMGLHTRSYQDLA